MRLGTPFKSFAFVLLLFSVIQGNSFLLAQFNQPFDLVGDAVSLGGGCYQLTDTLSVDKSAMWYPTQINLTTGFDFTFHVNITGEDPNGTFFAADGIAFVLQNSAQGTNAISAQGGNSLGYANTTTQVNPYPCAPPGIPYTGGITPSLAVEIDIFENAGACVNDLPNDHIAVVQNGDFENPINGPIFAFPNGADVVVPSGNYACREFRIRYRNNTLEVWYDGNLRVTQPINLTAAVFGGNPNVYFGFTGSNGAFKAQQIVCFEFANAGPDTITCVGNPVTLQGSGGPGYLWQLFGIGNLTNATTATPTFEPTGALQSQLQLSVTNFAGCVDLDTVIIDVLAPPTANAGSPSNICEGDSMLIGSNPVPGHTYSWAPPTGLTNPNLPITSAKPAVTTTYTLTVTDTTGQINCTAVDSLTITIDPLPISDPGPDATICQGNCTPVGAPSQSGFSYSWAPASGLSQTNTANPNACPTVTTTYTLTTTNTSTNCLKDSTVTITVTPSPTADAGPDSLAICAGDTITLIGTQTNGDIFAWTPNTGISDPSILNPQAFPATTTTYTLTVTSTATNCSTTDSILIRVNPTDPISISTADTFICNVDTIQVNATGNNITSWSWSPTAGLSDPTIPNPLAFPSVSTTYILTGTNGFGCEATDTLQIDVFQLSDGEDIDTVICRGDSLNLDLFPAPGGSGDYTFIWTGQVNFPDSSQLHELPFSDIQYSLMVIDNQSGCFDVININVIVSFVDAQVTPTFEEINPGQLVYLQASGGIFYDWSPNTNISCINCFDPHVYPNQTTTYTVTVWDSAHECSATAQAQIVVDSFQVPNVFTPNGDGVNDLLELNYYGIANYQIAIYDRWGSQLFLTKDPQVFWDGKNQNGQDLPEGCYYLVIVITPDGAIPAKDKQKVFPVNLVR